MSSCAIVVPMARVCEPPAVPVTTMASRSIAVSSSSIWIVASPAWKTSVYSR